MKRLIAIYKPKKEKPPTPSPTTRPILNNHNHEYLLPPPVAPIGKPKKYIQAFHHQFPTEIFLMIVDFYIQDCYSNADLRGIYRATLASRTIHSRLGLYPFRFLALDNFDQVTSFGESLWTTHQHTKAIDISCVVPYTAIQRILVSLQGTLDRLCLPVEQPLLSWGASPVLVPDLTLFYNEDTCLGNIRCRRLRLSLTKLDIAYAAAPHISRIPLDPISQVIPLNSLAAFALELSGDDFDTISTVYNILDGYHFTSFQEVVVIIYFHNQPQLDQFCIDAKFLGNPLRYLHVVYLLLEEHEQWTFKSLECRGEDFWKEIKARFELM